MKQRMLCVEALENRTAMSSLGGLLGSLIPSSMSSAGGLLGSVSPAIQTDLQAIQNDQQKLVSDARSIGPTLMKDAQALGTAVQTALKSDLGAQGAATTVRNDGRALLSTLRADLQSIGTSNSASRAAAVSQFTADLSRAALTLLGDHTQLASALTSNVGVKAALAQLKADAAPLSTDLTTLRTDGVQLLKDGAAQFTSAGSLLGTFFGK
jgi:hypothetical protein